MNKFRFSLLTSVILMGISHTTLADESNIYLGAGVGAGHIHGLNKIDNIESGAEDAAAANLFLGYDLNNYLSVEGGYLYLGHGKTDNLPFKNQGGMISLNGKVPLVGDLSLLAEAGGYWSHTEGLGEKDSKVSAVLGAGLAYQINDQFAVQARWRYIKDVADIQSELYQTHFEPNENLATLELVYHPFRSAKVEPMAVTTSFEAEIMQSAEEAEIIQPATVMVDKPFELSTEVHFNLNQTALNNEALQSLDKLNQQLTEINAKKQMETIVIGYSDSLGANLIRDRVSKERAEAVANYLVHIGVPESQMHVQAKTISDSTCSDVTNKAEQVTCLAPNRRVDIKITGYQEVEELASPW
ncbi:MULTISPECIES: outer membrane beta-barrel protein [unclassified Vibrio]|uniref:outer membrane beta-barrel protein n=3 Tax=Vibrio TaxID=662 RepID=UPI000B8E474C|nr:MULTISPECIES: outer membrane beta-barrel protein [unclassified Vibrio]OXX24328.1 hypothetical protein B9J88_05930 [Vibrio sp. V05_P4A8T149]OXX28098.1 hypothetical protein B9J95_17265 [Vibrio sp. V14_P6S14T42]OXX35131.1 hypothetical protein B9J81_08285 [Vibrio sp. V04_P4A5T148]OXX52859.1 hypothetical protein B9J91_14435 [Vibrio sp. V18_P1S4T112]